MPDAIALEAREVSKRYGPVTALDGVSLAVHRAECVALIGESGSGKTTLLRCFNRLTDPDAGTVLVDGADTAALDPVALRRRIGYVPQEGGLMPHWRVRRNVALVPWLRGQDDAAAHVDRALRLVGLEPAAVGDRWPRELSGGQRQRVAVARALASRPDLVLLDEPFGALDAITRADLQASFRDLRRELAITTLLVTHDLSEAFLLADRVAVMHAGRIEQVATPDELRTAPATPYVRTLLARARVPSVRGRFDGLRYWRFWAPSRVGIGRTQETARGQGAGHDAARPVVVASKPFGESYLLAEMFAQLLEARGIPVERRLGLGATEIAFGALRTGAIDVYPEYTGTGLLAILHERPSPDPRAVFAQVAREFETRFGVRWLPPLGFQNTYAIAVRRETAQRLGLRTLSDLRARARRSGPGSRPTSSVGRTGSPASAAPTGSASAKSARCCRP